MLLLGLTMPIILTKKEEPIESQFSEIKLIPNGNLNI